MAASEDGSKSNTSAANTTASGAATELPPAATNAADAAPDVMPKRRRGIYLLPNLITTGAMFAGFYAVVAGIDGHYVSAVLAVFVAMALDTADGRVARLTRTESEFGAEYDSLSDMVAFGFAPALLAFTWGVVHLGKVGWGATFVYLACAALRLARFNTQGDNHSFTGLASPSAAAIVACLVWVLTDSYGPGLNAGSGPVVVLALVTATTGLLMVSNFDYYSPKFIRLRGRVPFVTLVLAVLVLALTLLDPPKVLLAIFSCYALSGPAGWLWHRVRRKSTAEQAD